MNNKDLTFGGTFCVLPWIEEHTNLSGNKQFCCWSDKIVNNKDHANSLRQKIWNKEKIAHCESCYRLEDSKTISPRQKETARWLKDSDIKAHFDTETCPEFRPTFLDLRTNNKCNLACISCNPTNSSLWAKELGIKIENYKSSVDYKTLNQYKKIYMAGGEPLIIPEYLRIINFVADNDLDIEIVINTNLTNLSQNVIDAIKKIKKISFTVSIDAFGKINEYHRYPLKWSKFINNLNKLYDLKVNIDFNTVVDAVTIFGLGGLTRISHIPNSWTLSILTNPDWLKLCNIPSKHKGLALENLYQLQNNSFYNKDITFKTKVNLIKHEISEEGDTNLLANQIQIIDSRRKINHEDYLGFRLY